jgi:hypothetical protein
MATNPSKDTEQLQNTNENSDALDYHAVAAALESNDSSQLNRLMAAEPDKEDEQDPNGVTPDADGNTESNETDTDKGDSSQNGVNNEANQGAAGATPAAPAAPTEDEIRQELHRLKSEVGRVPALQRQLMQLQSELRAERARSSSNVNSNQSTESPTPKEVTLPDEVKRKIESIREVDPDIADAMELMYKNQASQQVDPDALRAELRQEFTAQREEEDAIRFQQEQLSILAQAVPQYQQVFASTEWSQWKDTLSPGKRALAESAHAEDVLVAINSFAHYMQAQMNPQGTHQNTSAASSGGGDPNASTNAATSGTSNIAAARNQKVNASPAVRSTSAKAGVPFDGEAQFHEEYARITKELGIVK